jgi:hypothetical protein
MHQRGDTNTQYYPPSRRLHTTFLRQTFNRISSLSSLPCDLHGLVYSYLEWDDKLFSLQELSRDETPENILSQICDQ